MKKVDKIVFLIEILVLPPPSLFTITFIFAECVYIVLSRRPSFVCVFNWSWFHYVIIYFTSSFIPIHMKVVVISSAAFTKRVALGATSIFSTVCFRFLLLEKKEGGWYAKVVCHVTPKVCCKPYAEIPDHFLEKYCKGTSCKFPTNSLVR